MGGYGTAALELLRSHNNTVTQNTLTGTGCYGIILTGSGYNKIEKNTIVSDSPDRAGILLENCEYNYIYQNNITSQAYGIQLQMDTRYNVFFKNTVYKCQDSVMMSDSLFNDFLGNTFSGASLYAIQLTGSDCNNFYWNNFQANSRVVELHETYSMTFTNFSYYAEETHWDNGKEGNYWNDYTGQDLDGDGVGETPYHVYENFTDNYPLTEPYDASQIQVAFKKWIPQSSLNHTQPTDSIQTSFSPENRDTSNSFQIVPVVAVSGLALAVASCALLWLLKKRPERV
jgi:parallel beta-helix repeat protein